MRIRSVSYRRSAGIAPLHRLKIDYRKPDVVSRKLDAARQKAFIEDYDHLLNGLGYDEALMFGDAVLACCSFPWRHKASSPSSDPRSR